jgi:WD repeat-containing protein 61
VAYSPDGQRLAAGASDGTVAVFDTVTGVLVGTQEAHSKPVRSLAFMPDSRTLLTACDDCHIAMLRTRL